MKIKIACLKKACLERKLKTGDKFLPRRGAADLGQWRGNFFAVVRRIFPSGARKFLQWCGRFFAVAGVLSGRGAGCDFVASRSKCTIQ
jgi:hypothetical protein